VDHFNLSLFAPDQEVPTPATASLDGGTVAGTGETTIDVTEVLWKVSRKA